MASGNVETYTNENPYVVASFYCNTKVMNKKNFVTHEFSVRFNLPAHSCKTESFLCPHCKKSLKVDLFPYSKKSGKIILVDAFKMIMISLFVSLGLNMVLISFWKSNNVINDLIILLKTKLLLIFQIGLVFLVLLLIVFYFLSNSTISPLDNKKVSFRQDNSHNLFTSEIFYYQRH